MTIDDAIFIKQSSLDCSIVDLRSSTFYFLFPSRYSTAVGYKQLTVNDQGKAHFNSSIQIASNYDVFFLFRYYFKGAGCLACY